MSPRLRLRWNCTSALLLLSGCGVQKDVEIITEPPGARIEVNNDYVGDSPLTVTITRDTHTTITAIPIHPGHYVQSKFLPLQQRTPKRIFFDMAIGRIRPTYRSELDVKGKVDITTRQR